MIVGSGNCFNKKEVRTIDLHHVKWEKSNIADANYRKILYQCLAEITRNRLKVAECIASTIAREWRKIAIVMGQRE